MKIQTYGSPIIIHTDEPSSGKPIVIGATNVTNSWLTVAEAPVFTVPLSSDDVDETFVYVFDSNEDREIVLGELLLNAPLILVNRHTAAVDVEVSILNENSTRIYVTPTVTIPANDAAQIALQGMVLTKTDPDLEANGDRLQIKASVSGVIHVYGSGAEGASAVHARDTESAT